MDIKPLLEDIKQNIFELVKEVFQKDVKKISNEINLFLDESKEKLQRWITLLEENKITSEEFELLILSQKEMLQIKSLHQVGVTTLKISRFKNKVLQLLAKRVFLLIGI